MVCLTNSPIASLHLLSIFCLLSKDRSVFLLLYILKLTWNYFSIFYIYYFTTDFFDLLFIYKSLVHDARQDFFEKNRNQASCYLCLLTYVWWNSNWFKLKRILSDHVQVDLLEMWKWELRQNLEKLVIILF
jgi:hypothetical protein